MNAYFKMESLEFYAKLLMFANQLGGPKELSDAQVQRLYEIRKQLGMTGKHPANLCQNMNNGCHAAHGASCGSCGGSCQSKAEAPASNDHLVAEITKRILAELNK